MQGPEAMDRGLLDDAEALQVALEASGIGLFSWDPHTDRVRWSRQIARLVGVEIPTFAAFKPMVDPADLPIAETQLTEVMTGLRDTIENTLRVRRADGRQIWMATRGRAIRGADGTVIRLVGTVADVTDSRRADELATAAARVETIG